MKTLTKIKDGEKMTKGTVFETLSTIKIDKKDIEKKRSV